MQNKWNWGFTNACRYRGKLRSGGESNESFFLILKNLMFLKKVKFLTIKRFFEILLVWSAPSFYFVITVTAVQLPPAVLCAQPWPTQWPLAKLPLDQVIRTERKTVEAIKPLAKGGAESRGWVSTWRKTWTWRKRGRGVCWENWDPKATSAATKGHLVKVREKNPHAAFKTLFLYFCLPPEGHKQLILLLLTFSFFKVSAYANLNFGIQNTAWSVFRDLGVYFTVVSY